MNKNKIIAFYDNYVNRQEISGVNDRIFLLYQRMKKYGLNCNSNVLELGCGIGAMTYLFSKTIKKGKIEAVEISSKSVEFARKKNKHDNVSFYNHDILDYNPKLKTIDFITLFDVIEHIPKEEHFKLFKNISTYLNDNTILLINIPNPENVEYDQKHQPELLQIIDQPVYLEELLQHFQDNNLNILHFEKYSIWVKNDYVFYAVEKKKAYKEHIIHNNRNFFQKAIVKAFRLKLKLFYNYS